MVSYAAAVVLCLVVGASARVSIDDELARFMATLEPYVLTQNEVVFLLDESGSIGAANFPQVTLFAELTVRQLSVTAEHTRVAIVTFATDPRVHVDYIKNSQGNNLCTLISAIEKIDYVGAWTHTKEAMETARDLLKQSRKNSNKIIILVTDGESNSGHSPVEIAQQLKSEGVIIFAVGVANVNVQEINDVATSLAHTYILRDFLYIRNVTELLIGDTKEVSWDIAKDSSLCDKFCTEGSDCCDAQANCYCGTRGGHYECACLAGYHGTGHKRECLACPKGTYKEKIGPDPCHTCPENSITHSEGSKSLNDCVCKTGYEGNPGNNVPCKPVQCTTLSAPSGGVILPSGCGHSYGAECTFKCHEGYCPYSCNATGVGSVAPWHQSPAEPRRCLENGEWSGNDFYCEQIRCPALEHPPNGIHSCSGNQFTFGTTCRFTCSKGYELSGSDARTCLLDGTWTGTQSFCRETYCKPLKENNYLKVKPKKCNTHKVPFRTTCVHYCIKGYALTSLNNNTIIDGTKQCLADTKWSGIPIEDMTCKDMAPPQIQCPKSITADAEPDKATATLIWDLPEATDNVLVESVKLKHPSHIRKPPYPFPIGTTKIVYEATDNSGLSDTCSFNVIVLDKQPPKVVSCPSDIEVYYDKNSEIAVNWTEPEFSDNSGKLNAPISNKKSGYTFHWGPPNIVYYNVTDPSGNKAVCKFSVKIKPYPCPYYDPPANGVLTCDNWVDGRMCSVFCHDGFEFAAKNVHDVYMCYQKLRNGQGSWGPFPGKPGRFKMPWPDCSLKQKLNALDASFEVKYSVDYCDDEVIRKMKEKFIKTLMPLEKMMPGMICAEEKGCVPENVNITCGVTASSRNKRDTFYVNHNPIRHLRTRRNLHPTLVISFNVQLNSNITVQSDPNCESCDAKSMREKMLQNSVPILQAVNEQVSKNVRETYNITSVSVEDLTFDAIPTCSAGQIRVNDSCMNCPAGTYKNDLNDSCVECPSATYQDKENSLSCVSCPKGYTTYYTKSKSAEDCKAPCKPGTYSKSSFEPCLACPLNTYQYSRLSQQCNKCPSGLYTWKVGATSVGDCVSRCKPGSSSDTGFEPCTLCPIGTFQPDSQQLSCEFCPNQTSTRKKGSVNEKYCQEIDVCAELKPCAEGSTCMNADNGYKCVCPEGLSGLHCEHNDDDCASNPCFNHGTCIDALNNFTCICPQGFAGLRCERDIDDCESGPCRHGGVCLDRLNNYTCVCRIGFIGRNCEINIYDCASDPCRNGGTCFDMLNNYRCCCPGGYSGRNCEQKFEAPDICSSVKCQNGGECISNGTDYNCLCPDGFTGTRCEVNVDDCMELACENGGVCRDGIGNATCECPTLYSGDYCEEVLTPDFDLSFKDPVTSNYVELRNSQLMYAVTISFLMRSSYKDTNSRATPVSYSYYDAVNKVEVDNALTLLDLNKLVLYLHGEAIHTGYVANSDSNWHHYAVTWEKLQGKWSFYVDGKLSTSGSGVGQEKFFWPGIFILGQEQDSLGGTFSILESFVGDLSQFNAWNYAMTAEEIQGLSNTCGFIGNIVSWPSALEHIHGAVSVVNETGFCKDAAKCQGSDCNCFYSHRSSDDFCKISVKSCDPNPCANGQACSANAEGAFCQCGRGYKGRTCEYDVDECLTNNGNCSHTCHNDVGTHHCSCPSEMVLSEDNRTCKDTSFCKLGHLMYLDAESWTTSCQNCTCSRGDVFCSDIQCTEPKCLPEQTVVLLPGECCPKCVTPSFCLVSSNNTILTLDMSSYEFETDCTYVLAEDCMHGRFRVQMEPSTTHPSENSLIIYQDCSRVTLSSGSVTVNGDFVPVPYSSEQFEIAVTNSSVVVQSLFGVSVERFVTGDSIISVPKQLVGELCGLCGDFNSAYKYLGSRKYLTPQRVTPAGSCHIFREDPEGQVNSSSSSLTPTSLFSLLCLFLCFTFTRNMQRHTYL